MHKSVQHKGYLHWASEAALWLPFTYIFSLTRRKIGSFSILFWRIIQAGQSSCHLGRGIVEILFWITSSVSCLKGMISYNWVTDCCAHRVVTELQLCFALKVEFLIAREEKGERIEKLQYEHFAVETNPKCHTGPLPVMSRVSGVLFSYIRQRVGLEKESLGEPASQSPPPFSFPEFSWRLLTRLLQPWKVIEALGSLKFHIRRTKTLKSPTFRAFGFLAEPGRFKGLDSVSHLCRLHTADGMGDEQSCCRNAEKPDQARGRPRNNSKELGDIFHK